MRIRHIFATAAVAAFLLPGALAAETLAAQTHATDKTSNPCSLMKWEDLRSYGATKKTPLTEAGWHEETPPTDLPGSRLFTNMCAITIKSDAGRSSVTLSFDSFSGTASEQQVHDWLKASASGATPEAGVSVVTLGDTTCESGVYNLPTSQDDGTVADKVEHYVACDQQVGLHHISLNVHVPEGNKAALPNAEQTKALLEKSIARLHKTTFAIADRTN